MDILNVNKLNCMLKLCRTCLTDKSDENLMSIFDNNLDKTLYDLTNILVCENDGYPTHICTNCFASLNDAIKFVRTCKSSQSQLQVLYDKIETNCSVIVINEDDFDNPEHCDESNVAISTIPDDFIDVNEHNLTLHSASTIDDVRDELPEQYPCSQCGKVFLQPASLRVHLAKHKNPIKCDLCTEIFSSVKRRDIHIRLAHSEFKPHKCNLCEKSFSFVASLVRHKKIHNGDKKHLCNTCGKCFYEAAILNNHMRIHTSKKTVVCVTCGKLFSNSVALTAHNKIHLGIRKYECEICGKRFLHSSVLKSHKRTHTVDRPYTCDRCQSNFRSLSYLKIHIRSAHTSERPYKCHLCPKTFASRSAQSSHLLTHSDVKAHECTLCGLKMARKGDLVAHMRTHSGDKPYICDLCPKKYHTASNLAAHKRTHTGQKNFMCPICNRAFTDPRVLETHKRIHTGERPYKCPFCPGLAYTQSGQLSAHKRNTHGIVSKKRQQSKDL